jgi:succinate-acetate transporter protein
MSEKTANPAPLGLLGFGMTTVLLNFVHNARLGPVDGMILGYGNILRRLSPNYCWHIRI